MYYSYSNKSKNWKVNKFTYCLHVVSQSMPAALREPSLSLTSEFSVHRFIRNQSRPYHIITVSINIGLISTLTATCQLIPDIARSENAMSYLRKLFVNNVAIDYTVGCCCCKACCWFSKALERVYIKYKYAYISNISRYVSCICIFVI